MRNITIITADDDAGMRLLMKKLIEKADGYAHLGEASDGEELISLFEETHPDVVLMDVEMPKLTGVECAKIIQDDNPKTVLVFATAHEEYMKDAFEVYAFDFLVKPFKAERALNTLKLIRERLIAKPDGKSVSMDIKTNAKKLMLKHRDGVSFIGLSAIALIQREDRATVIYLSDGQKYVTSETLNDLDERLPDDMFFRTHKSYIVSLSHIESISPYGRWTFIVKLKDMKLDALITHDKYKELQNMFI